MNQNYQRFCQILQECKGNIALFLQEAEKVECEDKAKILLKIGSVHIKENAEMTVVMRKALQCLENRENELRIEDAFQCALGYEKIREYDNALKYYEFCLERLPESAMKSALEGMKYRVRSKAWNRAEDYDLAMEAFSGAAAKEQVSWKREKWEVAGKEMKLQKERGWK